MSRIKKLLEAEPQLVFCALLAAVSMVVLHSLQGHLVLNLQDEGFLWYGTLRTRAGELPLLDFRAYDPGRYFWCAAWSHILGDGILALRVSAKIFAAVGLACGLLAASRVVTQRWALMLLAAVLVLWMQPRWKLFEPAVACMALYAAVLVLERPTLWRHLALGVVVGLAAFVGRNLGLYAGVATGALVVLAVARTRPFSVPAAIRRLGAWGGGVLLGYSPMLLLLLLVPGYWDALVESVLFYLGQSSVNLEQQAPWPWLIDYAGRPMLSRASLFSIGMGFLLLPLFYLPAVVVSLRTSAEELPRRALFIAATFVGGIFAHHVSVRSDVLHLAQCIHPLLLGLVALPATFSRERASRLTAVCVLGLGVFTFLAIGPHSPWLRYALRSSAAPPYVAFDARGDRLLLPPAIARAMSGIGAALEQHVPAEEALFVAPDRPGVYALFDRTSPTFDTYMAWPASSEEQQNVIGELADVNWALVFDAPVGGSEAMRFRNSYPDVWTYLGEEFVLVADARLASNQLLLRRK